MCNSTTLTDYNYVSAQLCHAFSWPHCALLLQKGKTWTRPRCAPGWWKPPTQNSFIEGKTIFPLTPTRDTQTLTDMKKNQVTPPGFCVLCDARSRAKQDRPGRCPYAEKPRGFWPHSKFKSDYGLRGGPVEEINIAVFETVPVAAEGTIPEAGYGISRHGEVPRREAFERDLKALPKNLIAACNPERRNCNAAAKKSRTDCEKPHAQMAEFLQLTRTATSSSPTLRATRTSAAAIPSLGNIFKLRGHLSNSVRNPNYPERWLRPAELKAALLYDPILFNLYVGLCTNRPHENIQIGGGGSSGPKIVSQNAERPARIPWKNW
ncbi:hypothetical protein FQR65_LT20815 [Abscondita terminalis]|nr:hypothetical protein FQR65_LT20815 [Abscondita terminalis]